MKKRLLSMFLCLCMLLTMVPAALAAGTTGTAAPATEDEGETSGNQITASTTTLTTGNCVLESDVTLTSGALKVEANNEVTLNLNGKKLTNQAGANTIEVAAGGTLTIEGPGTVDNVSHQKAAVNNSGTVVLNGGTYTRSQEKGTSEEDSGSNSYYTILNHGTMTINEGVTVNQGENGAGKFSSLIENGWYNGNNNTGGELSVMTINGGTFSGGLNTIKNDDYGELTIKGGTFSSYAQACLLNWNVATVEGGTFEGKDSTNATILNGYINDTMDKGQLTIQKGTFTGPYILEQMGGGSSIGSVVIKGGSFTGSSGIVNQEQGQDLGNGTIEISGGTFSHDVGEFCATGYACAKDSDNKYVVNVADGAQVSTDKDESGNVIATVDGNYSGGETPESGGNGSISTDNSGKVTIDVSSDDGGETTTGTAAEITVGSNALTSINKNEKVKEVELKTDVGTLTISDAAWNDMTAKATEVDKTASVVIKLEDKSKEGSNPVYEVTATVGEENAFDGSGDGAVTISVPYTADGGKGNVKVYCTDNGKMEDMNAALSDGILSWTTSHFSTFEVVAYDGTAEVTYQTTKDGTTSVSSGSFSDALTAVASNGGTITLLKDVTATNFNTTISKNVTIQGKEGLKINLTTGSTSRNKAFTVSKDAKLTLDGVTMMISGSGEEGQGIGDGFDVQYGGALELNNSNVTLSNLEAATISAKPQNSGEVGTGIFTLNHSTITATGIRGNFSNGGVWTLDSESAIEIDDCDAHGFSADRIEVKGNSNINVDNTAYRGISINSTGLGEDTNGGLIIEAGSAVSVTNCGDKEHPAVFMTNDHAANLIVNEGAILNVSATEEGKSNTISLSTNNGSQDTLNGAVIGTVTKGEESPTTYYEITFNVTPSDANIVVKGSDGKAVSAVNGKYALEKDKTYTYEVSKSGYRTQTGTFTVTEAETISVTLSSSGGGGGGGGSVTTKYTLSFDTNGGSAIAKVTKEKGTTVDLEQYVPTREGYTFAGWYSDEALTQKVTSVKLNGNTTVYAKWTENAVTPTLPFTDVKSGDWFYEAVQYVYDKGMMTGVSADRFAPASTTTRGMIVTILYRLENEPAVSGGSAFTDVESGAWYADAVAWAAANDIVNGTSATTFAPNSPITREQMAAILYRYAAYKGYDVSQKADLSGYTDAASISGYAKDALAWANAQKLITGVTDTTLNPQGSATRAQVATILMRLCETVVK